MRSYDVEMVPTDNGPWCLKSEVDAYIRHHKYKRCLAKKAEELRQKGIKYLEAVKAWIGSDMELKNGWRVYVPESVEDIVRQAEALKQCLVSADYIGKVIKGECVLVFVRFRGRPVATAEILPGGKLGQFYGNEADRNRCKPTKAATVAFDAWKAEYIDSKKKKIKHRKEAA